MYDKIVRAATRAMWDSELISSRVLLCMAEMFWAVLLFWPGESFTKPMYANMMSVFSENIWGTLFLVSAICQLIIVINNKLHSSFARLFACWNACLWIYVVASIAVSIYPPPVVIGGEIALATASFWIWIRPYILIEGYKRAALH